MTYRDMVYKVQEYSGLSETESERGLKTFIRTLSSRMTPHDRTDFASELPRELQGEAASTELETTADMADIIDTMAETQQIDKGRAKQLVTASWQALRDMLPTGGIDTLKAGLPRDVLGELTS